MYNIISRNSGYITSVLNVVGCPISFTRISSSYLFWFLSLTLKSVLPLSFTSKVSTFRTGKNKSGFFIYAIKTKFSVGIRTCSNICSFYFTDTPCNRIAISFTTLPFTSMVIGSEVASEFKSPELVEGSFGFTTIVLSKME